MTMRSREELATTTPQIDLGGPDGNAFALLAYAERWASQLGKAPQPILDDMRSGDYEHLLDVLEREFGAYVDFYR